MTTTERRVVITGATGLIGKALCEALQKNGYSAVVFSRDPDKARARVPGATEYIEYDPAQPGAWSSAIDGAYAVVNLAGERIFGTRWTEEHKRKVLKSRIEGTRALVEAMRNATKKPQVFISGSAVGYYGFRDSTKLDENAAPGTDFLADVCRKWEAEARKAEELGVRTVLLRTGIVLDGKEGALPLMSLPFKMFVGGPVLPGSQWFAWIHLQDQIGIILMAIENSRVDGPINSTAPEPQTNRDFSASIGKVLGRPSWFPVPGLLLKIPFAEAADVLTQGQRVIPVKAEELGYKFKYRTSEQALKEIFKK